MTASLILLAVLMAGEGGESRVRALLKQTTGVIELPAGTVELTAELALAPGSHNLEIRAPREGATLRAAAGFHGAALLSAAHVQGLKLVNVEFQDAPGDAVALGEGAMDFEVTGCSFRKIAGAAIAVHSASGGKIAGNHISAAGLAAVLIENSSNIRVENNTADSIGFGRDPKEKRVPAAILTVAGVTRSLYASNHFSEVNGHCISLVGFQDGEVRGNTCDNREQPEEYPNGGYAIFTAPSKLAQKVLIAGNTFDGMKFGGMWIAGSGYIVTRNRLYHVDTSHCPLNRAIVDQTEGAIACMPSDGIYLAARGNIVEDNLINGFRMSQHCVGGAPGVPPEANRVARNECSDDAPVNARNRMHQLAVRRLFEAVE